MRYHGLDKDPSDLRDAFRQDVKEGKWLAAVNVAILVFIKEVLGRELNLVPLTAESLIYAPLLVSLLGAFFIVFFQYWGEHLIAHYGDGVSGSGMKRPFLLYRFFVLSRVKHWFVGACFLASVFGLFAGVMLFLLNSG